MRFALFGAGRMGQRHAENMAGMAQAALAWVVDADAATSERVAAEHGGRASTRFDEVMEANDFDAAIVASPTDTHVELVIALARAGKSVLCEKPLDLDLVRAARCVDAVAGLGVPVQVAFNRRYDAGHAALARAVREGEIGRLQQLILTSRDFAPPQPGYIEHSGGMFRDSTIHDFDMIRFVSGEEPVSVTAIGSALFLEDARRNGDVDTIAVSLTLASGAICQVSGSRRAVYGHDQRIEVLGEKGMLISQNHTVDALERYTQATTGARGPFIASSRDRYRDAYRSELADFVERVRNRQPAAVTLEDGFRALAIADAATRSCVEVRTVTINYDMARSKAQ